mmetsp:Transcript_30043/g.82835  ORF Transcript_30043/g.82835 Transcript_30043/m.82835 type:complete len:275 (-) Transcript_30043:49-873(-)
MRRETGRGPQEDDCGPILAHVRFLCKPWQRLDCADNCPLVRQGGRLNQRHGGVWHGPVLQQALADGVERLQAHVEHGRLLPCALGQLPPVQVRQSPCLALAHEEAQAVDPAPAVRQRHEAGGGRPGGGSDPGHHLSLDSMLSKELELFAATTEDEGVAALQAHDAAAAAAVRQQQLVDLLLLQAAVLGVPAALAHVHELRRCRHQAEDVLRYQVVVQNHLSSLQPPQRPQGQELRIARPRPHERYRAARGGLLCGSSHGHVRWHLGEGRGPHAR